MKISEDLGKLGLIKAPFLYSVGTRDDSSLFVYKDPHSGVVYIDKDVDEVDEDYVTGEYNTIGPAKYEKDADTSRRIFSYEKFLSGKTVLDFGCGSGTFISWMRKTDIPSCMYGVELNKLDRNIVCKMGVPCYKSLEDMDYKSMNIDVVCMFHVLEHIPNPLYVLEEIRKILAPKTGKVIIEVPHANDFLLDKLECLDFKRFTLWSKHLMLHTRISLERMLEYSGFRDIHIEGVQRYGLANHLYWLGFGVSGGHKSNLSVMETNELKIAYTNALSRIDANDTLVAIATAQP
jgi:SAM-dependent methyltransferase